MLREHDACIKAWLESLPSVSSLGAYVVLSTPERVFSQMKDLLGVNVEQVPIPIIAFHRMGDPELLVNRWIYYRSNYRHFKYGERSVTIGIGNGSQTTFEDTLTLSPIRPKSVKVTAGNIILLDDGEGNISGLGGFGLINYDTGSISIAFSNPPASGVNVVVNYETLRFAQIAPQPRLYFLRYQIDLWTRKMNDMNLLLEDIISSFDDKRFLYLTINWGSVWGTKYVPCILEGIVDNSDLEPIEEERKIRKTVTIGVEAWSIRTPSEVRTVKDTFVEVRDSDTNLLYHSFEKIGSHNDYRG